DTMLADPFGAAEGAGREDGRVVFALEGAAIFPTNAVRVRGDYVIAKRHAVTQNGGTGALERGRAQVREEMLVFFVDGTVDEGFAVLVERRRPLAVGEPELVAKLAEAYGVLGQGRIHVPRPRLERHFSARKANLDEGDGAFGFVIENES